MMHVNPARDLSTDDIRSERKAIADLQSAIAAHTLALTDILARMATEANREIVGELIDDVADDMPNFVLMNMRLNEARDE